MSDPAIPPAAARKVAPAAIEWPTLALAVAIYGGWLALTLVATRLPAIVVVLAGGWLVAWHGSLQHETIHGHPTRRPWLNDAIGAVPLSLWLPYAVYRRSHRAHHASAALTDPFDDPESRYLAQDVGARAIAARTEATLAGRLVLGPPLTVLRFLVDEAVCARRTPATMLRDWAPHVAAAAIVLAWLARCGITPGAYLLEFVYPGLALTLLRSFAEHRAASAPAHRAAVVESAGPLAWLFLNNNLHAAHHEAPGLAWYRLPAYYRRHRAALLAANGGLVYRGYGAIVRRYGLRAHDRIVHPAYVRAAT